MQNRILAETSYYPWGHICKQFFHNFLTTRTSCLMLQDLGMLITENVTLITVNVKSHSINVMIM